MIDAKVIADSIRKGGVVYICGNGGLAAESEHFAAELMGKYAFETYFPCIALTTNSALITAISNYMGFENVFSHPVETLGRKVYVLMALTTSASKNVLKAVKVAQDKGMITFLVDRTMLAGGDTAEIQNNAIQMLHQLAYEIKEELQS